MKKNELEQILIDKLNQLGFQLESNIFVRACQESPSVFMPNYFNDVTLEYKNKLYNPCLWKYPWICCIDMSKFPGCDHFYSTLNISGWKWMSNDSKTPIYIDFPRPDMHNIYRYEIIRTVTHNDIYGEDKKGSWEGYQEGDSTRRFTQAKIPIICSILWVLKNVQGAVSIGIGSRCDLDNLFKIISVDKNDQVTIHSDLYI